MQARKRKKTKSMGGRPGRPKLYAATRILLSLAEGALEAVDQALAEDEIRQDFIRAAIARELKRRS